MRFYIYYLCSFIFVFICIYFKIVYEINKNYVLKNKKIEKKLIKLSVNSNKNCINLKKTN